MDIIKEVIAGLALLAIFVVLAAIVSLPVGLAVLLWKAVIS